MTPKNEAHARHPKVVHRAAKELVKKKRREGVELEYVVMNPEDHKRIEIMLNRAVARVSGVPLKVSEQMKRGTLGIMAKGEQGE